MSRFCFRFAPVNGYDIPGLERWNLYGQQGERLLFVEYIGEADLEEFLPRFARMLDAL